VLPDAICDGSKRNFLIVAARPARYTEYGRRGQLKIRISDDTRGSDGASHAHVQRRLDFALSGFLDRIGSVAVRFSAVEPAGNGGAAKPSKPSKISKKPSTTGSSSPKRCEIEIKLRPRAVCVEDVDVDLLRAIDNATARLQRSLARALEYERAWPADQVLPLPPAGRRAR
jgi:ribosome-associated translation inhibitor RaiA